MSQPIRYEDTESEHIFDVQLVKLAEPVMIKNESKTNEKKKNVTSVSDNHKKNHADEYDPVLDLIFVPREWEENGITWRQVASTKPASQNDLIKLNEDLESTISKWNIQSNELDPIRQQLLGQYFDELIRQVYLYNNEMGELLIKIRNKFKLTMECYLHNFDNGFMFNVRKSNINEIDDIKMDLKTMKEINSSLKENVNAANINFQTRTKYWTTELKFLTEKNEKEIQFFTKNHEAVKEHFKTLLTLKE